jgi:hypothetical protein
MMDKWSFATIDAYVPISDASVLNKTDWLPCPKCGEVPRLWIFDNGRHAKCCCGFDPYSAAPVRVESIMSVYRRTGSTEDYDEDAIRQAVLRESDSIPPGFKLGRRLAWKSSTVEKWLDKKNAKAERLLSR